jgi:hypothetical protein
MQLYFPLKQKQKYCGNRFCIFREKNELTSQLLLMMMNATKSANIFVSLEAEMISFKGECFFLCLRCWFDERL